MIDWSEIQAEKFATEPPPENWPEDIVPVSIKGAARFGIHKKTGKLHWDGQKIRTLQGFTGLRGFSRSPWQSRPLLWR